MLRVTACRLTHTATKLHNNESSVSCRACTEGGPGCRKKKRLPGRPSLRAARGRNGRRLHFSQLLLSSATYAFPPLSGERVWAHMWYKTSSRFSDKILGSVI